LKKLFCARCYQSGTRENNPWRTLLDSEYDYVSELRILAKGVFEILKSNFVGFYIIGSFVMGDWGKLPTKTKSNRALRDLVGKNLYENIKTFRKGKIEEFTIEKSYLNRIASYGLSKKKKILSRSDGRLKSSWISKFIGRRT
jgi:hypothetical protein